MNVIIRVEGDKVQIGTDDNKVMTIPKSAFNYPDPEVGDVVKAYKQGDKVIIARVKDEEAPQAAAGDAASYHSVDEEAEGQAGADGAQAAGAGPAAGSAAGAAPGQEGFQAPPNLPVERRCNKHLFVWVCNLLFGDLGVDRFMRGQIGLGILKLVTIGACGVWGLVDFIVSLIKAYGGSADGEDLVFIDGKYAR